MTAHTYFPFWFVVRMALYTAAAVTLLIREFQRPKGRRFKRTPAERFYAKERHREAREAGLERSRWQLTIFGLGAAALFLTVLIVLVVHDLITVL